MSTTGILDSTRMTSIKLRSENASITSEYDFTNPGTTTDVILDALLALPLVVSFYTFTVLTIYELQLRRTNGSVALAKPTVCQIATWLRLLCLLGALSALMRCINDYIYYKSHRTNTLSCTAIKNLGVSWLVGVDTFVYLFLWLRQRVLYGKRSMRHLTKWYINLISWLALILIVAIFVAMNVMLGFRNYHYDETHLRCYKIYHAVVDIIPRMWTITSSILHGLLVILYVYPLVRHAMGAQRKLSNNFSAATKSSNSNQKMLRLVRKCVVISLFCVVTDLITMLVTEYWMTQPHLSKLRHLLYNCNAILNVVLIVGSLKKWRKMLFPFKTSSN